MSTYETQGVVVYDQEPAEGDILSDVLAGLGEDQKRLPPKLFYDSVGAELFEQICDLPEYYVTRTELAIMCDRADAIAESIGHRARVVEFGSGEGAKIRVLLDDLGDPAVYVPIDISKEQLVQAAITLQRDYPDLHVQPVCADYSQSIELPPTEVEEVGRTVVYFPGSTIGNLEHDQALSLMRRMRSICGPDGAVLIGFDLQKDPELIEGAYNDARGLTARFNLHLLERIRDELGGEVDVDGFEHRAIYDTRRGRIEMRLVSRRAQSITVGGRRFDFEAGEWILTEYSHKYTRDGIRRLADEAELAVRRVWADPEEMLAVVLLSPR